MSTLTKQVENAYHAAAKLMLSFNAQADHFAMTATMAEAMATLLSRGNKILVCGNGGSACQAMHFAEELTGRYRLDRKPLAAISLTDAAHITCVGNDYGYDSIFSRSVEAYGQQGDGLFILSTSGNSPNLLHAAKKACHLGMTTFALLGKGGGQLLNQCDYDILAPGSYSDGVQNIHMIIIHVLIEAVERILFPNNYTVTTPVVELVA